MATSQDFVNWVCGPDLDPHFLKMLLIAENESLFRFGKGTTHTTIYFPEVKAFHVCLPQVTEQRRIVAKLEELMARSRRAKEALDAVPPLLDKLRQSILAAAFRGDLTADWRAKNPKVEPADKLLARIRAERRARWGAGSVAPLEGPNRPRSSSARYAEPRDPEGPAIRFDIPETWQWVSLDLLLGGIEAGASFSCEERPPSSGEVGVLKVSAVTWGEYDEEESKTCGTPERLNPSLFVRPGDFLFSRANTIDLVGACVIASKVTRQIMLSDKILRMRFLGIPPEWVLHLLRGPWGRREIERLATGNQESMRNIGQDRLRQIRLPIPPLPEIRAALELLAAGLSAVEATRLQANACRARSVALDEAVLAKAFRGELLPQAPSDEPASALLDSSRNGTLPHKGKARVGL